jgi:eukaryotic-like serine/threonine-protein kinase
MVLQVGACALECGHIAVNLVAGARIGPYEIVAAIGAGGMGEVYRARDVRLARDVAIKVLSRQFSSDADRLMRFEREARTLASLNHSNIAQIFGTEREGDIHALAMEFVAGEDLSHILARGALPLDDAVSIARQIADALEAAHDHGIIHRDLKPANVKVRADGTVKVLDFGLAKTIDSADARITNHPTLTSPAMTQVGAILGTAAYMSPEQAKGKAVDRGSDLWAFGAVLYEMLAGRAAFDGETVTDVLAAIVTREPDWSALPAHTPPAIHRLLRRCLDRDRRRRLADAGEARFQLEEARAESEPAGAVRHRSGLMRVAVPWAIAALLAIAVVALVGHGGREPVSETSRYDVTIPSAARLAFASRPALAVSADGRTIVFVASVDGIDRLFVRRTDSFDATEIPGTQNAHSPSISPDGRTVAFAAGTRLAKVPVAGGAVTVLADIVEARGISWDDDTSILYAPNPVGAIWRIPATGGPASQVTKPSSAAERTHRWPQQLPGGAMIFTIDSDATPDTYDDAIVAAQMPDGSRHTVVVNAAMARYVPTGHLLFARGGTVFAVPFDPARAVVNGTPIEILHEVAGDLSTGAHHFAASQSGTLVYISGGNAPGSTVPVWEHRSGTREPLPLPAGAYNDLRLSPDGQQLAATVIVGAGSDIWVHQLQRRAFTKITFGGQNVTPMWSRDGATLYYTAIDTAAGTSTVMRRPADGSRQAEPLTTMRGRAFLNDVTADDRMLVISRFGAEQRNATGGGQSQIIRLPIEKNAVPVPMLEAADEFNARLSPDGRWVAHVARTPGREIVVRSMTGGARFQVSTGGGEEPKWSRDGRQLYYRNDNVLMSVTIEPRATVFESSLPTQVLKGIYNLRNESGISYDVDPKEERFLMLRPAEGAADALSLRVITNWTNELSGH